MLYHDNKLIHKIEIREESYPIMSKITGEVEYTKDYHVVGIANFVVSRNENLEIPGISFGVLRTLELANMVAKHLEYLICSEFHFDI